MAWKCHVHTLPVPEYRYSLFYLRIYSLAAFRRNDCKTIIIKYKHLQLHLISNFGFEVASLYLFHEKDFYCTYALFLRLNECSCEILERKKLSLWGTHSQYQFNEFCEWILDIMRMRVRGNEFNSTQCPFNICLCMHFLITLDVTLFLMKLLFHDSGSDVWI